jgi:hypothetical protein
MDKPIELRFIPLWLSKVVSYYNTDPKEFESIVSSHDQKLFKLANHLLRSKLKLLGITDYVFPAVDVEEGFDTDEALFALYGNNEDGHKLAEYTLKNFVIVPDKYDGILLIEKPAGAEEKELIYELLLALALYRGKEVAYSSDLFKQYLVAVNKNYGSGSSADHFHEHLKAALAKARAEDADD